MKALITALNIVYDEAESRGFIKLNGLALLLTFGGILFMLLSLALITALPFIFSTLGLPDSIQTALSISKWPVLAILIMVAVSVLYRYAPDRDRARFRWISWGAVVATLLWIAASLLFSFYVSNFGSYNKTYGSMGTIIILLMWFFLTAYAVLIGSELNAEMEHQTKKDTTRGKPEPMDQRGAHAADTVGRTPE
jgi:membrane protein